MKTTARMIILSALTLILGLSSLWAGWDWEGGYEPYYDVFEALQVGPGGSIYAAGYTEGYGNDFYMVKVDQYGENCWMEHYGNKDDYERCHCLLDLGDGTYLLAGERIPPEHYEPYICIYLVDKDGDIVDSLDSDAKGFIIIGASTTTTEAKGFILIGATRSSTDAENYDIIFLTSEGTGLDSLSYHTITTPELSDLGNTNGAMFFFNDDFDSDLGGFILATSSRASTDAGTDYQYAAYLQDEDDTAFAWSYFYYPGSFNDIFRTGTDENYLTGYAQMEGQKHLVLAVIDDDGDADGYYTYAFNSRVKDYVGNSIMVEGQEVYISGTVTNTQTGNDNIFLAKLDVYGNQYWIHEYYSLSDQGALDMVMDNNEITFAGYTGSGSNSDGYLLRDYLEEEFSPLNSPESNHLPVVLYQPQLVNQYSTQIQFSLNQTDHISLNLYDVNGREVFTLEDATLPAGHYTYCWNHQNNHGTTVSSGVYFCRITSSFGSLSEKITVTR